MAAERTRSGVLKAARNEAHEQKPQNRVEGDLEARFELETLLQARDRGDLVSFGEQERSLA